MATQIGNWACKVPLPTDTELSYIPTRDDVLSVKVEGDCVNFELNHAMLLSCNQYHDIPVSKQQTTQNVSFRRYGPTGPNSDLRISVLSKSWLNAYSKSMATVSTEMEPMNKSLTVSLQYISLALPDMAPYVEVSQVDTNAVCDTGPWPYTYASTINSPSTVVRVNDTHDTLTWQAPGIPCLMDPFPVTYKDVLRAADSTSSPSIGYIPSGSIMLSDTLSGNTPLGAIIGVSVVSGIIGVILFVALMILLFPVCKNCKKRKTT